MRGEYVVGVGYQHYHNGSPPHAWGIQPDVAVIPAYNRFTPTCVGNTKGDTQRPLSETVHPHMRGEYIGSALRGRSFAGSPPHAWGIRSFMMHPSNSVRFTPTCVGNTTPWHTHDFN